MATALARMESTSPLDASIESIIPGLQQNFQALRGDMTQMIGNLADQVTTYQRSIIKKQNEQDKANEELAKAYMSMAEALQGRKRRKTDRNEEENEEEEEGLLSGSNIQDSISNIKEQQKKSKEKKKSATKSMEMQPILFRLRDTLRFKISTMNGLGWVVVRMCQYEVGYVLAKIDGDQNGDNIFLERKKNISGE